MRICFPVLEDHGMESAVYGHFGSAPKFLVVDTSRNELRTIENEDLVHQHGACNPVAGLAGEQVDAIAVGGIGGGALFKLNNAGIRVFQASQGTVAENIELLGKNALPEFMPGHTCGGHGHGHDHGHGQGHGCSH